jgi:hypothetical protein
MQSMPAAIHTQIISFSALASWLFAVEEEVLIFLFCFESMERIWTMFLLSFF